jgi:hypothetical protein
MCQVCIVLLKKPFHNHDKALFLLLDKIQLLIEVKLNY